MLDNLPKIAGCSSIAASIKKSSVFSAFYDQLVASKNPEIGVKPVKMPSPFLTPAAKYCNASAIKPIIEDLPLTWLRVDCLGRWGVYFSVIALYGDRHWLVRDRSGLLVLRVFDETFCDIT